MEETTLLMDNLRKDIVGIQELIKTISQKIDVIEPAKLEILKSEIAQIHQLVNIV